MQRAFPIVIALLAGCAAPQPPLVAVPSPAASDSPFLGCWSLSAPEIPRYLLPSPEEVRFTDSTWAHDSTPTFLILHVGQRTRAGSLPPRSYWGLLARDSARVGWGDGFTSFTAVVRVEGDSLRGSAWMFTDGGGDGPRVPLIGRRIGCTTPGQ